MFLIYNGKDEEAAKVYYICSFFDKFANINVEQYSLEAKRNVVAPKEIEKFV